MAAAITLGTALIAYFVRVHPLWAFAVAALLGLSGLSEIAIRDLAPACLPPHDLDVRD